MSLLLRRRALLVPPSNTDNRYYLYKDGDLCTAASGNWGSPGGYGGFTNTEYGLHVLSLVGHAGCNYRTGQAISTVGYHYLKAEIEIITADNQNRTSISLGLFATYAGGILYGSSTTLPSGILSFDVSSHQGSFFIGGTSSISYSTFNNGYYVKKVWLEP